MQQFQVLEVESKCEVLAEVKNSGVVEMLEREQSEIPSLFPDEEDEDYDSDDVCYSDIAITFYNHKHGTDFKVVRRFCNERFSNHDGVFRHCSFLAATDPSAVPKRFFAVFVHVKPCVREVVLSCLIISRSKRVGCCTCDSAISVPARPLMEHNSSYHSAKLKSDEEKCSEELSRTALAYYNKKHNENYEFVDTFVLCGSAENYGVVAHCNFKAKRNSPGDDVSSTELFFAEMCFESGIWKNITCRIIGSKRTEPCHLCEGHRNMKKVVHPSGRYRYGFYDFKPRSLRKLPKRRS